MDRTNPDIPSWGYARRAVTATTTIVTADRGYTVDCISGTYDIALTDAATLGAGFCFGVYNSGSGTVTINPSGAETIRSPAGSAATLALTQGQGVLVLCDGTGFEVIASTGLPPTSGSVISGLTTGRIVDAASSTTVETAAAISTDQTISTTSTLTAKPSGTAGIRLDANAATGNFTGSLSPANLTANRRWTFPDADITVNSATGLTGIVPSANGGTGVNNAGTITNASNTTITGGGTIALGGFTLTVPATGTAGLLAVANTWTAAQSVTDTTAAASPTVGALVIGNGTAATSVAIGGGIIYAGGPVNAYQSTFGEQGIANPKQVTIGYAGNYDIQAVEQGVAFRDLRLQPNGGATAVGGVLTIGAAANLPASGQVRVGGTDSNFFEAFHLKNLENDSRFYVNMGGTVNGSFGLPNTIIFEAYRPSLAMDVAFSAYTGSFTFRTGTSRTPRLTIADALATLATPLTISPTTGTTLTVSSAQDSTSKDTGSIVTEGGIAGEKNFISAQGIHAGVSSTATAAGTTTLTSASRRTQIFTGSTTQTLQLPAANLFGSGIGVEYIIINRSTGTVTAQRAGSDTFDGGGTTDAILTNTTRHYVSNGSNQWHTIA